MDVKLLMLFVVMYLVCVTDQRRVRHDRGRNGLRRYGSGRHHKGLGRHQGQGRRLASPRRRKLVRMLPYEAEEDVKVRERMNVSLWKLGARSSDRLQRRPKRDVTAVPSVLTLALNPKMTLLTNLKRGYNEKNEGPTQKHDPLKRPWPIPQEIVTDPGHLYRLDSHIFHFTLPESMTACSLLTSALKRYFTYITGASVTGRSVRFRSDGYPVRRHSKTLDHVDIYVDSCTDGHPGLGADEAYRLQINDGSASIVSREVWGTLRGLETLSQLVVNDSSTGQLYMHGTEISDSPRFPYRGVVINTSQHFLHIDKIRGILRMMEQSKLNTLHWVLSVGQAFNMNSTSEQKTGESIHHYSSSDVTDIVEYARERGIMVVPELNTLSFVDTDIEYLPDKIVDCIHDNKSGILDISNNLTYSVIRTALGHILVAFPQSPVHLWSSLPDTKCWKQSLRIKNFMSEMGITDYPQLLAFHTQRLVDMIREMDANRSIKVDHVKANSTTNGNSLLFKISKLKTTSAEDGKELAVYYWCQRSTPGDLDKLYDLDETFGGPTLDSDVMGGELCIWGEHVHSNTGLAASRLPMTTVAGRLWSDPYRRNVTDTGVRVHEHVCRMIRRETLFSSVPIPDTCKMHVL